VTAIGNRLLEPEEIAVTEPEMLGSAEGPPPGASSSRRTSLSLLEGIRGNDADAWRRLVYLYSPLIYSWFGKAGVRPPDADDAVQEVFKAAVARLGDFRCDRPGDSFRGWLRVITRNVLLAHRRLQAQRCQAAGGSDALRQLQEAPDPADPAEEDDSPSELRRLYLRALELVRAEFEDRTWQAFWLVAVEGRTTAEVAAQTGVSAAAVRQAKSRVLRRLKEEVGDLAD
jgi:RNA polymerase sigma-70 factor (ECF subfamily)